MGGRGVKGITNEENEYRQQLRTAGTLFAENLKISEQ